MSAVRMLLIAMAALVEGLSEAVIDQFFSGEQMVSKSVPSSEETWADPVELSGSLFATRTMNVQYGVQSLRVNTTLGQMEYVNVDSGLPGNDRGYFEVFYNAAGTVDFTEDGASAIRLIFSMLGPLDELGRQTDGRRPPIGVGIEAEGSGFRYRSSRIETNSKRYVVDFPFDDYPGTDFSKVVSLQFRGIRLAEGFGYTLESIETVPEPSASLLMLAAAPLLMRRRRSGG